ncbi:MAG: glycoside hydrolase family 78 protein [Caldilinea sp.]|nr:glycoside hydrolase family 78 protein [Caldilinea sp.]MDW8441710.1 glycoside hydrolase family 78 protein [Caldilineaceae bacterium]
MSQSEIMVSRLQVEHLRETIGIGFTRPRLSWQVETASPGWRQTAYAIECLSVDGQLRQTTERVESDRSILVDWPFAPLRSRERVSLRVKVWGKDGGESAWSEPLSVEAGLLEPADWSARFITPDWDEDVTRSNPAPYLRCEFTLRSAIHSARLYITALGLYEAEINGQTVGDHVFAPGWTVYDERLRYQTFDVTGLLKPGRNALGAVLGDGWFRGRLGFGGGRRNIYGERLALLAQLEVQYTDGSVERIVTDEAWRAATGPILSNSIYDGETYDARLEQPGWSTPGFDDAGWSGVRILEWNMNALEAPLGPPVRRTQRVQPVSIFQSPSGKTIVDFGQNLVGRLAIEVSGPAGHTITLRHAEVLERGELGTRPLRFAEATDRYTLKGEGIERWEPRFTFHGFRYAEVNDWPGELRLENLTAVVIHSDMERTGWFECSDPLLNRLHENVVWSMRGNFLDVPTDCPQRDERLGWTGDLQVFVPTASYLYDVSGVLRSWLRDLAIEQRRMDGMVPHVVPNVLGKNAGGAAAWGDAATVTPWVLYQRFGDAQILGEQFESMRAWVDFIVRVASETLLWDKGFQFGDWLDPTAPPDKPWQARTDPAIVATAYFAHSAELTALAAEALDRAEERERYAELAAKVKAAFAHEYVTPAGRIMCDAETAYALALVFDLLPTPEQRHHAGDRLAELVRAGGYHIRTGFVGTPLICDALCQTGHHQTAYRLLTQRECPSWLYPVTMGATTIWERWDSMLPDGSINPGEMTSFNHYALGAVADWMHRTIGGLVPLEPGYRRMKVEPRPGAGLTYARTRHLTPYGAVDVAWKIENGVFTLELSLPPNTSALVTVPGADAPVEVGSGVWRWTAPYQDPDARGPYTVDDLVSDLFFDSAARKTILATLEELGAPEFFRRRLPDETSATLRQALRMLPNYEEAVIKIDEALKKL